MAFLARCPDCGKFQVCVLDPDNAISLMCEGCGGVFSPVVDASSQQGNVNWELATTMAGFEFEPPTKSKDNLVVVAQLPSVYPNQPPPRKPTKQHRETSTPQAERQSAAQPSVETPPQTIPERTDQAAFDPTIQNSAPQPSEPPTAASLYRLPPPEAYVAPTQKPDDDDFTEYGRFDLNGLAWISLSLLVVGLLLIALTSLNYLPLILIVLSFAIGIFAARSSLNEGRRLLVPSATLVASAVVLIASITAPGLLGPEINTGGAPLPPMAENYVVPHPQFAGDPNVVNAEWVDASKASVVHGGRRVEVTEVRIAKSSLSVRIQLQRSMSVPGIPGGPAVPTTWNDKFVAVLYDNAGSRMEQQSAAPANNRNGPPEHLEIILKFSNVSKIDGLRLEIPAAAWGGTGVVKFAIPAAMVRR